MLELILLILHLSGLIETETPVNRRMREKEEKEDEQQG